MWWYNVLKSLHILSAITAVGANLTYGIWLARGRSDRAHLGFALRTVKLIDDRIANPAYGVLLVTGLVMTFTTWGIGTRWIITGIVLYAVLAFLGIRVFAPVLASQIAAADAGTDQSPEFTEKYNRTRGVGIFISVLLVAVVFVMVFKPAF